LLIVPFFFTLMFYFQRTALSWSMSRPKYLETVVADGQLGSGSGDAGG
jgi:hypothetical protein